jgi:hypothetical protein
MVEQGSKIKITSAGEFKIIEPWTKARTTVN